MDFFQTLVNTSVELCYRGNHLKLARKRKEWEFDNIVKYNFADYYITAYWMYKNITEQSSINVWAGIYVFFCNMLCSRTYSG